MLFYQSDPAFWLPHGYALLNVNARGYGLSTGKKAVLSEYEANDLYDVVEWAASQTWCNSKVGLNGVSYLAMTQYQGATLHPPHLSAICPWEGLSDFYRDLGYPGGVREIGFVPLWMQLQDLVPWFREKLMNPLMYDQYRSMAADLEKIKVPALICASFSDQGLHTQGTFRLFEKIGSKEKWLYTHRSGKWVEYYGKEGMDLQLKFFNHYLKGEENGMKEVPSIVHQPSPTIINNHHRHYCRCPASVSKFDLSVAPYTKSVTNPIGLFPPLASPPSTSIFEPHP